jgi:acyl carrier protein
MTTRTPGPAALAAGLRGWLITRLALYLDRPAESLDEHTPLAEYGMDSVTALSLCGDLEDEHGLIVDPSLVWDYPTIAAIVEHLTPRLTVRGLDGYA